MTRGRRVPLVALGCVVVVALVGGSYIAGIGGPTRRHEVYLQAVPNPDVQNVTGVLHFDVFAKNPNPVPVTFAGDVTVSMLSVPGNRSAASLSLPVSGAVSVPPDQVVRVTSGNVSLASVPPGEYDLVVSAPASSGTKVLDESISVWVE